MSAAAVDMMKPVTWPDWTGEAVAIVASGPSVSKAEVALLKGRLKVIGIKQNVTELCPWADVAYGCDFAWWKHVQGLPTFAGLKLAYDPRHMAAAGVRKIQIPETKGEVSDQLLFDQVGVIGGGGNSGFQALNLAVQFGAVRVLLLGFDVQSRSGVHWYGRNIFPGMANPGEDNFPRWRRAFEGVAPTLAARGVEVINASKISDLRCWPRMSVSEALQQWGLL